MGSRKNRKEGNMIKKIKLNLFTGSYTVIRDAGSVIITRRKTSTMSEFMQQNGPGIPDGNYIVYMPTAKKEGESNE